MTTSNYTIQSTFHLAEEQVQPLTAESNDFFSNNGLSYSCFLPLGNQKQPSKTEDHVQPRHKAYHHIKPG